MFAKLVVLFKFSENSNVCKEKAAKQFFVLQSPIPAILRI